MGRMISSRWSKLLLVLALVIGVAYWQLQANKSLDPLDSLDAVLPDLEKPGITVTDVTDMLVSPEAVKKVDSVGDLTEGLRARLEKEPDDLKGWVLLAQSYHHLQRWQEAGEAFKKARALGYSGEALPLPEASQDAPFRSTRRNRLAPPPGSSLLTDYLTQTTTATTDAKDNLDNGSGLKLEVTLNPALVDQVPSNHVVFIFARATGASGKAKVPLAVLKKRVGDLPLIVVLDDSMAMVPEHSISGAKQIVVGARISQSGNPMRQAGDFEALSNPVPPDYQDTLTLIISKQITDN